MDKKLRLKALSFSLLGFVVVTSLLNLMNDQVQFKTQKKLSQVQFKTKKIKKKTIQKIPKKVAKKAKTTRSLKPKMDLSFASGGLDLGIDILGIAGQNSKLLSQAGETIMTEDVVDRLPEVRDREVIPYPEMARDKNINGHVTVNILVSKSGDVEQVKLLDSTPEGVFETVALQAVKNWSFSPAEYKGKFVSVWVKQKLKFQVN